MDYKITSRFECNGSDMMVVKLKNCVHAIIMEEWRKIYGRNNLDRWGKVTDWGSYSPNTGYGKFIDGKESKINMEQIINRSYTDNAKELQNSVLLYC